jgi:hypothetical protein
MEDTATFRVRHVGASLAGGREAGWFPAPEAQTVGAGLSDPAIALEAFKLTSGRRGFHYPSERNEGVPGNPGTPIINRSLLLVGDIHLLLWEFRKFVHRPMLARTKIDGAAEPQIA